MKTYRIQQPVVERLDSEDGNKDKNDIGTNVAATICDGVHDNGSGRGLEVAVDCGISQTTDEVSFSISL